MEKTPVSLLQEIAIKDGYVPKYIEQKSTTLTNECVFSYIVQCKGYSASGTGPSKKMAKHSAASAMLKVLRNENETPENCVNDQKSPISVETNSTANSATQTMVTSAANVPTDTNTLFASSHCSVLNTVNYIGKLQEYCATRNITLPAYDIIKIDGPPHNPLFTVRCTIPDVSEEFVASTKKIGRQFAAKKVLQRLGADSNVLSDNYVKKQHIPAEKMQSILDTLNVQLRNIELRKENMTSEEASKVMELCNKVKSSDKSNNATSNENVVQKPANYHSVLQTVCHSILTHSISIMEKPSTEDLILYRKLVKEVLKLDLETVKFPVKKTNVTVFVVGLRLNTQPTILQIGIGNTQESAEMQAFQNLLALIKSYCIS